MSFLRTGLHGYSGHGVVSVTQMVSGAMDIPLWWYPEGPAGWPNVVGAYRAIATIGSPWPLAPAVYADSLQNWANPGTYDLTEIGGGSPNWAANVGWSGFQALNRCLNTNIVPTLDQTWTALVEYGGAAGLNDFLFGVVDTVGDNGAFLLRDQAANVRVWHGSTVSVIANAPALAIAGNYGFAGRQPYRNGAPEAALVPVGPNTTDITIYVGARNVNGAQLDNIPGSIAAFVIYSGTLTGAQIAAVDAAMGQL